MKNTPPNDSAYNSSQHETFGYFSQYFDRISILKNKDEKQEAIKNVWKTIKEYYIAFKKWYLDYKLFHYIGWYLITKEDQTKEKDFKKYGVGQYKIRLQNVIDCNLNSINQLFKLWKDSINNSSDFEQQVRSLMVCALCEYDWIGEWDTKNDFEAENKDSKRNCMMKQGEAQHLQSFIRSAD